MSFRIAVSESQFLYRGFRIAVFRIAVSESWFPNLGFRIATPVSESGFRIRPPPKAEGGGGEVNLSHGLSYYGF